jgi:hypothetical protein
MSDSKIVPIQCHCGSVGIELKGEPLVCFYCHCDDCQLAHGSGYVPAALYRASDVTVTRGKPFEWKVKTTPRVTCGECGTRLFACPNDRLCGVTASLLPRELFKPQFHIFCQFALLPINDDLPHYKTLPEKLGGSNETVDW